jgi:hypothetical protein
MTSRTSKRGLTGTCKKERTRDRRGEADECKQQQQKKANNKERKREQPSRSTSLA